MEQADLEFIEVWLPLSQSAGPLPPGETGPLIIQAFFRIEAAWPMTLTFRASLSPAVHRQYTAWLSSSDENDKS